MNLRCVALYLAFACSGSAGAETGTVDSRLLDYTRNSLNLSLCAVVFEEEHGDRNLADQYQNGSAQAEALIREGGWSDEEALRAHELVLQDDFSFTLPPDTTWGAFRKTHFSRELCDGALASVASQRE